MADVFTLYREIVQDGLVEQIARNPQIAFGTPTRPYLGQTIFPERLVPENQFTEDRITYFTAPANDGTRYSEPQLKHGELVGTFDVKLGEIDIARQLTGRDFDNIRKVGVNDPNRAKTLLIAWLNTALNLSVIEKEEIQRWQALENAAVTITGTDGKVSTIPLSNPAGHRITIPSGSVGTPAGWYGSTVDPMESIFAMKVLLAQKGYELSRIIADSDLVYTLATNTVMESRLGSLTVSGATLTTRPGLVSPEALNASFQSFGLPPIEQYNLSYRTQSGTGFFKTRGKMVFLCATGRNEVIDLGDAGLQTIEDTAGYYAIGTAVGENEPGRVVRTEARNLKPVGIYGQGFQTSFPVLTEPEAVAVITIPKPSP